MKFTVDTTAKAITLLESVTKEELDKIFKSLNMLGVSKEGVWIVTSEVQYIPNYPIFPNYPIVVANPIPGTWSSDGASITITPSETITADTLTVNSGNMSCVGYNVHVDTADIQIEETHSLKSL